MSHYVVLVVGNDPEEQLAPFDENLEVEPYCVDDVSEDEKQRMMDFYTKEHNETFTTFDECYKKWGNDWDGNCCRLEDGVWKKYSTYNPDSKWDWYLLGGRWSGCFIKLKEGATGVMGYSGVFGNEVGIDQALKKDIDFDCIRREAREKAVKTYRGIAQKCGGTIPRLQLSWKDIINEEGFANMSIEEKREMYRSQEAVKIWREKVCDNPFDYNIDDFQCSEEEYANRAELNSFVPYAVLYEGEWISRGDMGWWGITLKEHHADDEWKKKVWELLQNTSDDTLLSFYDLHI